MLFGLFILALLRSGQMYQELGAEKISKTQESVSAIINERANNAQIAEKLTAVANKYEMELIILDSENKTVFTTFPGITITNIRDIFEGDEVLYKSQGVVPTVNGDLNVMMVIYQVSAREYLNGQFVLLIVYITVLFLMLIFITNLVNRFLFKPLEDIRTAIQKMRNFDVATLDENTAIGAEFKEFVIGIGETLENATKQYTDLELVLLFDHQRLDFLLKIAKGSLHDLKTPLYQSLLKNKNFLVEQASYEDVVTYNITRNESLLTRINYLLNSITENVNSGENELEYFDVIDLFYEIEADFDVLIEQKHLTMDFSSTENTMVYQNKFALKMIMHNMLSNAVKYTIENSEVETELNVDKKQVEIICKNIATEADFRHLQANKFSVAIKNENFSSGNGVYLIKELAKTLGGEMILQLHDNQTVEIKVVIPQERRKV